MKSANFWTYDNPRRRICYSKNHPVREAGKDYRFESLITFCGHETMVAPFDGHNRWTSKKKKVTCIKCKSLLN